MAKDYFQDIVPPESGSDDYQEPQEQHAEPEATPIPINTAPAQDSSGKSIRNISAPARPRPRFAPESGAPLPPAPRAKRNAPRILLWSIAAICVLLVAALVFVALRATRVSATPRTHSLNYSGEQFTAYPASAGGVNAFTYTVQTIELEDSEVVPSEGTVYAEEKASGNLTVYNNYQTAPLTLVKNTRFETPSGLIFRTPSEIVVPGKSGSTPGSVRITVVADQAGEDYNVAPGKFTVPGLRSTPAMYAQVYAESSEAFSGGFKGERPGVEPGALESAIRSVQSRLETKAREAVSQLGADLESFPELAQIEYTSLPNTAEAGDSVRVRQKASIQVPVFSSSVFASAVSGSAVSAGDTSQIDFVPGSELVVTQVGTSTVLGQTSINFTLSGAADLVWHINVGELQAALAGKDKSAFEAIVGGFPAIQEASARIEPFWKSTFPSDPSDIKVDIEEPKLAQ